MRSLQLLPLLAAMLLAACGSTPKATLFTLDDGRPRSLDRSRNISVVVLPASIPDLIDRPQMVLRVAGNQVVFSETQRWAEPLRREIPRLVAADLGRLLHSPRVMPSGEAQPADPDFRVALDVQQLDATPGRGVDIDVLWRLQPRRGAEISGRSTLHEAVAARGDADFPALVAAQRRALAGVAAEIAALIDAQPAPAK